MLFVVFPSGGCGVPAVIQGGVGSLRSRPCVLLFSSGSPAVSPWRSAFVLAMALRADSPYVVIPVPDPFLWHWFVWQAWMPFHFAMALHQCMPCPCCGFLGSDRPGGAPGLVTFLRMARAWRFVWLVTCPFQIRYRNLLRARLENLMFAQQSGLLPVPGWWRCAPRKGALMMSCWNTL